MSLGLRILGCGSSGGVPRVAQGWGVCDPDNPRNRRRRCSILIESMSEAGATRALIDTSPDLRDQLIEARVFDLDAILYTHAHADHIHGIDDIRPLIAERGGRMLDAWMDAPTSLRARAAFDYVFATAPGSSYPPLLTERRLEPGRMCHVHGAGGTIDVMPIRLDHGEMDALGFRIGAMAYAPDLVRIPPESMAFFEELDLLVIDGLRYKPHPTHLSIPEALDLVERFRPRRAILTNLSSEVDYETLRRELPVHVAPAFDGMRLDW